MLPLSNGTDLPGWEGLEFDGSVTTEDFGGLTVVRQSRPADTGLTVVRQRRSASDGSCLYIVRTAEPQDGLFFQGCTAGVFPAVAQFTVTSTAPEACGSASRSARRCASPSRATRSASDPTPPESPATGSLPKHRAALLRDKNCSR